MNLNGTGGFFLRSFIYVSFLCNSERHYTRDIYSRLIIYNDRCDKRYVRVVCTYSYIYIIR